jgi:hypothetical protein
MLGAIRNYRICLILAWASLIIWLLSSYAISNNIRSVARLLHKMS